MRRRYELYIDGRLADIASDTLVLMNYKESDATAPAAVYNSWSQHVTLPRTSANDAIFGHIHRLDRVTGSGFSALERTPFTVYSDTGEVLESGYLKMDSISRDGYTVTLYGGLGGFLYLLTYNADGTRKTLADLEFKDLNDQPIDLTFRITRDTIREAWTSNLYNYLTKWGIINFAPCYNGVPDKDFDAGKAFCPTGCYGVTAQETEGGVTYRGRGGHAMVNMPGDLDEWATCDLRSYLQRPVISMRAVLLAIKDYAADNGYNVQFDPSFFADDNPYHTSLWMTLLKIDGIQMPNSSGSETAPLTPPADGASASVYGDSYTDVPGPWSQQVVTAKHDITVSFIPTIQMESGDLGLDRVTAWEVPILPSDRGYIRFVVMYQLVAYDSNGIVVGGSKVAAATTYARNYNGLTPMERSVSPATFIRKYNNPIGTPYYYYTPAWMPEDGDTYEASMVNGDRYHRSTITSGLQLCDASGNPLHVTLEIQGAVGVASVKLRQTCLGITAQGTAAYYTQAVSASLPTPSSLSNTSTVEYFNFNAADRQDVYSITGTARSGATITKALLLGSTRSPGEYLLSHIKTFGLYLTYDPTTRTIGVMGRNAFYTGETTDIQGRIDRTTVRSVPYFLTSRWYDFISESEGAFADYVRTTYGKDYGMARVNTGFQFNADHNDVLKDSVFKGAAEVLHKSKHYLRITEDSKVCPAPFVDGGTYTLWASDGSTLDRDIITPTDNAVLDYYNALFPGYDAQPMSKAEFCDSENKALDGSDVLLFYERMAHPAKYSRYTLTDDNGLMVLYNGGKACWLLGQDTIEANHKYRINHDGAAYNLDMPVFHRFAASETTPGVLETVAALEFGLPPEIDNPELTCTDDVCLYRRAWAAFMTDRLDADTRVVTCKVDLRGFQVGQALLRRFWYFDGCVWVLNGIKNHVLNGDRLTECEFIKVKNKNNYTNGQNYG